MFPHSSFPGNAIMHNICIAQGDDMDGMGENVWLDDYMHEERQERKSQWERDWVERRRIALENEAVADVPDKWNLPGTDGSIVLLYPEDRSIMRGVNQTIEALLKMRGKALKEAVAACLKGFPNI
ncbi:hypothetical protein HDU85_003694 [Gaertneriomyces sp. JEL0708]|nr:hypothetical protein HDU85_003694 [Gaertneriomyces sp. JEL0708]